MKRSTSNILTVVIAFLVLTASALFGFFILPIITEDADGQIATFSAEVNTPQEIIQTVSDPVACQQYFPYTYSKHTLMDNDTLDEDDTLSRKAFLDRVIKQLDILFHLKIDSIILEKYTQVWRYSADSDLKPGVPLREDDVYFIDILFTDAKLVQWRITAGGYSDEIFYLSCLETQRQLSAPVFSTSLSYPHKEAYMTEKMKNAVSRFEAKLYDPVVFPNLFGANDSFESLGICIYDSNNEQVYWYLHLVRDDRYLLTAYSAAGNVPLCYSYLNIKQETGSYFDAFWDLYN